MRRLIVVAALSAALVAGVLTFPRAYEPGRSESRGPDLTLVRDGRLNEETWSRGRFSGSAVPDGAGLRISSAGGGRVIVSRTLALFEDACYVLDVEAKTRRRGLTAYVLNERAQYQLTNVPVAVGASHNVVSFVSNSRRVSLLMTAEATARASILSITLERDRNACR